MLGLAGAGKGTQAHLLSEELDVPSISSGDLFRYHRSQGTELGRLANRYMEKGELVPDGVTIRMILERIEQVGGAGFVLDGFPRTLPQAGALDQALNGIPIEGAVYIQVSEDELVQRLSQRLVCDGCAVPYSKTDLDDGSQCGKCDGVLYQRDDDKPEVVRNRLQVQWPGLEELLGHYSAQGKLIEINGEQPAEQVAEETLQAVSGLVAVE